MWGWGWSSLTEHLLTHARFWVCLLALQSRKGGESKEKKEEEDNNDLGVVTPTCEPSTHEAEAGGLLFQGYPRIYRKMLSLKAIKEKKWEKTSFWRCRAIGRAPSWHAKAQGWIRRHQSTYPSVARAVLVMASKTVSHPKCTDSYSNKFPLENSSWNSDPSQIAIG